MNTMKQKLKAGETVFGQMILELFTPGVAAMLGNAGLDFVIYDMEHGRCGYELLSAMVTSCRGTRLAPIARVPDFAAHPMARLLDIGAQGVMIPRLETADQMQDAVAQLKYSPCGRRGVALGLAHDNFRPRGASYFAEANDETVVIAIIETPKALEDLDAIVATPGVDVAWVGHYDLTVALGIPSAVRSPGVSRCHGLTGRRVPEARCCRRVSAGDCRRKGALAGEGISRHQSWNRRGRVLAGAD
jgi:2-keto-3-deoxy-L-rhamnonate aldolase RhmA